MEPFDSRPQPRVVCGPGTLSRLGDLARDFGFRRTLLTADPGLLATGYVERASRALEAAGIDVFHFHDFDANPDTDMIERGRLLAAAHAVDSFVGLGGGSSLDCAKAVNFVLTNGGGIKDYWGYGTALKDLHPMISVPTTAGTGSEAQCYALISDATTHVKMACGDDKAFFRVAILDPELTLSQPASVTATAGFDAVAHAVETWVTTKRNAVSDLYSREAFGLLTGHYERVLAHPEDLAARAAMQVGAYFAGVAIENSMLGATHACANPLTARYGTTHGVAIAILLPHVVRWNRAAAGERYRALEGDAERLARRLEELAAAGGLRRTLRDEGVPRADLEALAEDAAKQWTGRFNPRAFDKTGALEIYECAF